MSDFHTIRSSVESAMVEFKEEAEKEEMDAIEEIFDIIFDIWGIKCIKE